MNKTLLLVGIACLFATSANATDFQQYVSAKGKYVDMKNKSILKGMDYDDSVDIWDTYSNNLKGDDSVLGGSLAYGIKTWPFRTELELNIQQDAKGITKSYDEGDGSIDSLSTKISMYSAMLNAYYDIDTGTAFTPYLGAGIGVAKLKAKWSGNGDNFSKSSMNISWQIGAGVSYAMTDNVSIDTGYRYVDNGKISKKIASEREFTLLRANSKSHEIYLGARYSF